ncbi:60S ribosomal protein L22 [Cucumis sativus]|uniref:60S ribosomal protein L22 n=1 Tax=Cucumis sativus TaxID=3659 RepID=UPI0012F50E60|nr:60S ribosomal protein L22 [Cucumis sativus]
MAITSLVALIFVSFFIASAFAQSPAASPSLSPTKSPSKAPSHNSPKSSPAVAPTPSSLKSPPSPPSSSPSTSPSPASSPASISSPPADAPAPSGMLGCCLADTPIEPYAKLRDTCDQIMIGQILLLIENLCSGTVLLYVAISLLGAARSKGSVEAEYRAMSLGIYIDVKLNDEGAEENQGKNDEEWIENGVAIGLEVVELNEAVLAGDL